MLVQRFQWDAIEEFFADQDGWDAQYLQLSPGALGFRTTVVSLPGVQLFWNVFGNRMRLREVYNGSELMIGIDLSREGDIVYRGRPVPRDHGYIYQPNLEHDFVVAQGAQSLLIYVDLGLLELMAWTLDPDPLKVVPRTARKALIDVCRWVTERSAVAGGLVEDGPEELLMRDEILARLDAILRPWLGMSGTFPKGAWPPDRRNFKIYQRVTEFLEQHDLRNVPAMEVLAAELGLSRRRLFYVFRQSLGMGPYAYLEILRLHRLRYRLLKGKASGTSVTCAATELGFGHLGRLSNRYRKHFGESPKETLKRGPG